jgi:cytochrome c biogenesis protein CcmG, thiol:disulfide interchange protein DsbE
VTRTLKLGAQAAAIAAVVALLVVLVWRLTHQHAAPRIGGPAPTFSLSRLNGSGTLRLESLRGKAVVLNFWASWCGPCKAEAPALERLWKQYRSRGVVFIGIDTNDAAGDARRFLTAHGITYPVVSDKNGILAANSYGIADLPVTYFVDRRGRLVATHLLGPVNKFASGFRTALAAAMAS